MRNTLLMFSTAMLISVAASAATGPAEVKLTWQNPEKYTDIRPGTGTKKAYQQRVIKAFDKIWAEFAEKLPAGYKFEVVITDLDLAGDVEPMYSGPGVGRTMNDIRVVKDIYFPKMNLDYVLYDANNVEVAKGTAVKIKDMGFMQSGSINHGSREFGYEQHMLEKWFEKEVLPKVQTTAAKS
ncbi:MAG TPA: DUF3016 domain-containing protein [Rheinheimera sp.]|uniref:DUF3016 domain-containing protein n=1 Tax=Rheinheimera sp. TaxID=1869214 RepID=UPI000ED380DC|nr:DUF3016 domain-containing protein [Rheinheimera sp.]HCU64331.1 DUF3016 domain-containing protein [Rheinheimera sp.]